MDLTTLNPAQLQAVQHPPDVPLQILAGPGSGKTKVLTSRIAHLILTHNLPPWTICAVTFTNKAAKEMRERLIRLIGKLRTVELKMGTFHALCANFLRRHGGLIGLADNFTICDADESKAIVAKLLKPQNEALLAKNIRLEPSTVLSLISKAKSKGYTIDDVLAQERDPPPSDIDNAVNSVWAEYEQILRKSNSLDFDDLLLFGNTLFTQHPEVVRWCRHVLVDEFQDTNTTQYELMRSIAAAHRCITIVGDPDQSIYGWRSAEVENLAKMSRDFPRTQQIFLEQNYRSTASILSTSLAIVAQDENRIPKTLFTSHASGPLTSLRVLPSEHLEAAFIAYEMKRLRAQMGGLFGWGDFVILLRFNALSRVIEGALQAEGIPHRVLAGHKFFDRMEVKDLLAYLQLVDNPSYAPAFARAVNVPHRGIGEKTLAAITMQAERLKLSPLVLVERICDSKIPDTKPSVKRKLVNFVKCIRELRRLDEAETSPADLIRKLVDMTEYEEHLKRTQENWEMRVENVQELLNFASEVLVKTHDTGAGHSNEEARDQLQDTPLRSFLQASILSPDEENDKGGDEKEKVTISTCHAAKGLEWPVVIVPAVEKGVFPFCRSEDIEEERRLLYVACTRAQGLLYITHAAQRKVAGESRKKELSAFISAIKDVDFAYSSQELSSTDRELIARILSRPVPDEQEVAQRVAEFKRTAQIDAFEFEATGDVSSNNTLVAPNELHSVQAQNSSLAPPPGPPPFPTFISARVSGFNVEPSTAPLMLPPSTSTVGPTCISVNHASTSATPPLPRTPSIAPLGLASSTRYAHKPAGNTHAPVVYSTSQRPPSRPDPTLSSTFSTGAAPRPPPTILSSRSDNIVRRTYVSDVSDPRKDPAYEDPSPAERTPPPAAHASAVPVKRRLGMGRSAVGYNPKKKFRPPL